MSATLSTRSEHPVILFDGVCNLCNASVDFVMARDRRERFRFGSLQSEFGRETMAGHGQDPEALNSFALLEDGTLYTRSTAALRVARRLGGAWPLLYVFILVPRFLRDAVYGWIARNRYRWFGKSDTCRLPTAEEKARFV